MDSERTIKGNKGTYVMTSSRPFAYGRISVFFKALDETGHQVCIKLFRESPRTPGEKSQINEFIREITAQMTLKHPHILPILDHGVGTVNDPAPFLVLPLCEKGDLREFMSSRAFIPINEALPILEQVALAIDFAHKSGFIHGDIKPENILFIRDASHCCLSDFGMSKYFYIVERVSSFISQERGGGSAAYLSPEQIEEGKVFPSSDIYSFAIIAYELLTGALPFAVSSPPFKQMQQKIKGELIDPLEANPTIATKARDALLQGLKADRRERPASAFEFCQMLMRGVPDEAKNNKSVEVRTISDEIVKVNDNSGKGIKGFWRSLETTTKVAIVTAVIAALAGIITAIINIIPQLRK